jgi:hypothetical protein
MNERIDAFLALAQVLAGLSLVVVVGILIHLWRRPTLPTVSYGGVELTVGRMRWLWTGALVGAVLSSALDNPIAIQSNVTEDPERVAAAALTRSTDLSMPLPFFQYSRERTWVEDTPGAELSLAEETVTRGLTIPRGLFAALAAYGVLVIWWNPDSRWPRRILHGKKRRFLKGRTKE